MTTKNDYQKILFLSKIELVLKDTLLLKVSLIKITTRVLFNFKLYEFQNSKNLKTYLSTVETVIVVPLCGGLSGL